MPISDHTFEPVRQFIFSGTSEQQVPDDSVFHQYLLKALRGEREADQNGDGYLTGSELGAYLRERITVSSRGKQTPHFGKIADPRLNRGEFVFVSSLSVPPPSVATLPADW